MFCRVLLILLFPVLTAIGLLLARGGGFQELLPPCLIHEWTGLHCPGCGGTRAFQFLAHGDLLGAIRMNLIGSLFVVLTALWALRTSWEAAFPGRRWPRFPINEHWAWGAVAVMVLFTVLRNVPLWPFTLLAPH